MGFGVDIENRCCHIVRSEAIGIGSIDIGTRVRWSCVVVSRMACEMAYDDRLWLTASSVNRKRWCLSKPAIQEECPGSTLRNIH